MPILKYIIDLTQLEIEPESIAPEANAHTTWPSELRGSGCRIGELVSLMLVTIQNNPHLHKIVWILATLLILFFLTPLLPACHNVNRFVASFLVPLLYFLHLFAFFIVLTVRKKKTLLPVLLLPHYH